MKKEVEITFKTITPLWTGGAWQYTSEIRPSSFMGSLRFWFETIMYFAGILEKKDFNFQTGRFEKEVDRKKLNEFIQKNGNDIKEIIKHLIHDQQIPISSVIFGTTNWKSLIEIKEIKPIEDYCFGNRLSLPSRICINKKTYEIKENNDCPKRSNNDWSVFFFLKPYFYGKFKVTFLVEKQIIDSIFYPLLTFMDKYGFWGGKWNLGYGRVKIENQDNNWRKEEFQLENKIIKFADILDKDSSLEIDSKPFEFVKYFLASENFFCGTERDFKNKTSSIPLKIKIVKFNNENQNYTDLIKELLKKKAGIRNCLRHIYEDKCFNDRGKFLDDIEFDDSKKCNSIKKELLKWRNFRHELLGTTTGGTEGTKIIPWIYKEDEKLKGGFISIAGILKIKGDTDGQR